MANIKIMALGGLGENGKNLYIVETIDQIFILDAGLKYPDIDMYGVDGVVPNLTYLKETKKKIAGIFISHGHEDNIGAIPYILRNISTNVYGTHFSISLVENLLVANKMDIKKYKLYRINENKVLSFNNIKITFFNTSHSIPESIGIAIHTEDGVLVYATDFNFMPNSDEHYVTSFSKITDLGKEKILLLMTESVGTGSIGRVTNDIILEHNFNNILTHAKGRVIISAYSSDLSRIQKIINLSLSYHKKIAFVGNKGEKVVETAILNNYLKIPNEALVNLADEKINKVDNNDLVIIVHGQREEPYTMLVKMILGEDKLVKLVPDDQIVIMCVPVSGTEKITTEAVNILYRYDCNLTIYDRSILRPSHASREDLKLLYEILKPKFIMPIKGEYRHMYEQLLVALDSGYSRENIILLDNGEVISINDGKLAERTNIVVGNVFVDGSLIGDVNEEVIKDRETLSSEGAIIVTTYYNARLRKVVKEPMITTKGVVGKLENNDLILSISELTKRIFENSMYKKNYSLEQTQNALCEEVGKLLYRILKHRPLIIPVFIETTNVTNETKKPAPKALDPKPKPKKPYYKKQVVKKAQE